MIHILLLSALAQAASPAAEDAQNLIVSVARYGDDGAVHRATPWWTDIDDPGLHAVLNIGLQQNPELLSAQPRP